MGKIAIPTHNRWNLIQGLTLGYLKDCGVAEEAIDLFVGDEAEAAEYRRVCRCGIIVTGATNVRDKFNYIHTWYRAGEHVMVVEDDLKAVEKLAGYNKLVVHHDLLQDAVKAFNACHHNKTALWGISSNSNPFFLKDQVSVGFKFIVANLYGFIQSDPPITVTQMSKTDYERTILYYKKYGSVVRLDYLCPITKNYKTAGGMSDVQGQRYQLEEDSVNYLTTTYSDLCTKNETKKSQFPEMSLRLKRADTVGRNSQKGWWLE